MPPVLAAKLEVLLSYGAQEEMIGSRASTSVERVCAENKQLLSIKALSLSKWLVGDKNIGTPSQMRRSGHPHHSKSTIFSTPAPKPHRYCLGPSLSLL